MKRIIAVVEDEVYMREELCNMLQKDGYLVKTITEFEDAARLLAALRPDLVILDLNLPEISGFQICQELKNNSAIVIPQEACSQVQDKIFVYIVTKDNKVKYSEIKVNPQDDGKNYIVTAGLHVGDRIVLKGITKLTDGQQIKPITLERYNQKIAEAAKLAESQDNAHAFATAMGGKK